MEVTRKVTVKTNDILVVRPEFWLKNNHREGENQ